MRRGSASGSGLPVSAKRLVETVKEREFLVGRQRRMIGDVVGRPREAIEGEDRSAPLLG